jgi:hypothetical protein
VGCPKNMMQLRSIGHSFCDFFRFDDAASMFDLMPVIRDLSRCRRYVVSSIRSNLQPRDGFRRVNAAWALRAFRVFLLIDLAELLIELP